MITNNNWKVERRKFRVGSKYKYAVYRVHNPDEPLDSYYNYKEYATDWLEDKAVAQAFADKLNKNNSKEIEAIVRIIRPRISIGCDAYCVAGSLMLAGFGELNRQGENT